MSLDGAPRLSVVVPAYNEEARIAAALERIAGYLTPLAYESELIVVDDGSSAAGRKAIEEALAVLRPGLARRLLRHETNRGKGAAVRTGCQEARARFVAFVDADLASPPESLGDLIAALEGGADVAVGVRNQADGTDMRNRRSLLRRLAGRAFAAAVGLLLLPGVRDSQCPLKAFRQEAAQRLFGLQRIETWSFDAEILYLARRLRMKVAQVPVTWSAVEGSHLRVSRSLGELVNLLRIRWIHRGVKAEATACREHETSDTPA
jgi:glycosyltransferase involved in cell wall biosynthesis